MAIILNHRENGNAPPWRFWKPAYGSKHFSETLYHINEYIFTLSHLRFAFRYFLTVTDFRANRYI
jgi:hypothetical protein